MTCYRIVRWKEYFEKNRSRELKVMTWVPVPTKQDGDGYTELLDHPDGAAHFGAWIAIVQVAAKCEERGTLTRDDRAGTPRPHDAASLSRITRIPAEILEEAIARLLVIGWLESISLEAQALTAATQDGAGCLRESRTGAAPMPQGDRTDAAGACGETAGSRAPAREQEKREQDRTGQDTQSAGAREPDGWIAATWERIRDLYPEHALGGEVAAQRAVYAACRTGKIRPDGVPVNGSRNSVSASEMVAAVAAWAVCDRWVSDGGRFVPHLSKFLESGQYLTAPAPSGSQLSRADRDLRSMQAVGARFESEEFAIRPRLEALAAALPSGMPDREAVGSRILALTGDCESIEQQLAAIDREMLAAIPTTETMQASVTATLRKLDREADEASRQALLNQVKRRTIGGLPVLSLFSGEAEPLPAATGGSDV